MELQRSHRTGFTRSGPGTHTTLQGRGMPENVLDGGRAGGAAQQMCRWNSAQPVKEHQPKHLGGNCCVVSKAQLNVQLNSGGSTRVDGL